MRARPSGCQSWVVASAAARVRRAGPGVPRSRGPPASVRIPTHASASGMGHTTLRGVDTLQRGSIGCPALDQGVPLGGSFLAPPAPLGAASGLDGAGPHPSPVQVGHADRGPYVPKMGPDALPAAHCARATRRGGQGPQYTPWTSVNVSRYTGRHVFGGGASAPDPPVKAGAPRRRPRGAPLPAPTSRCQRKDRVAGCSQWGVRRATWLWSQQPRHGAPCPGG